MQCSAGCELTIAAQHVIQPCRHLKPASSMCQAHPVGVLGHDQHQLHNAVIEKPHQDFLFQASTVVTTAACTRSGCSDSENSLFCTPNHTIPCFHRYSPHTIAVPSCGDQQMICRRWTLQEACRLIMQ